MNKILTVGILALAIATFGCLQTGSGKVSDTVANVETQGLLWKTTELYLTNDHDAFYCIRQADSDLKVQAERMAENKSKVKIQYQTYFGMLPWECASSSGTQLSGDSKYNAGGIVTKIESVN